MQLHQHQDMKGEIFGKEHSVDEVHRNEATQCDYEITILNEKLLTAKEEMAVAKEELSILIRGRG